MHAQAALQETRQIAAGAEADDEDALGLEHRFDRALAGLGVQGLHIAPGVGDVFLEHGGENLRCTRVLGQLDAQLLYRLERSLEAARQFGAKLRIARQIQRAREPVGRRHRHTHGRGKLVDGHGGHAKRMGQDVFGHFVLRAAQPGLGPGDTFGNGMFVLRHEEVTCYVKLFTEKFYI